MDPNSDESKREGEDAHQRQRQGDDSVSVTPAPSVGASATTGMLQVPDGAMENSPAPVPDAQVFAALEEEISDEEAAIKKPRGNVDVIDDEDAAPLPAAAMAASMNIEDDATKGKRGAEIINGEEDDNAPPHDWAWLQGEEEGDNLNKKHTEPQLQPQPQPQSRTAMEAPPNQESQDPQLQPHQRPLGMAVPSQTHTNQGGENTQDPPNTRVQPRVRVTSQPILPRPITASDTRAPSAPILEATPVDNEIYDAEVMPAISDIEVGQNNSNNVGTSQAEGGDELPWWKKHQRYIIFGIVLVLCVVVTALGTLLATQGRGDGGTENNDESKNVFLGESEAPTKRPTSTIAFDKSESPVMPLDSNTTLEEPFDPPGEDNSTLFLDANSTGEDLLDHSRPTTLNPSKSPSANPTNIGTFNPITLTPSKPPTFGLPKLPTVKPTTSIPSKAPTVKPTDTPTFKPTALTPSKSPSDKPTNGPTSKPTPSTQLNSILNSQTKLLPNDGAADDRFGYAVAVDGNTVVVGAYEDDNNGISSGSAYVYIREGDMWIQQAKLLPNDETADDYFGRAVAISGNTAVVGADGDDDNGSNSGSAYVYIREGNTWKQQAKLLPNDGAEGDQFGIAVAVDGDTVVVGANRDNANGFDSGSAYVFIREGGIWIQQARLLPNDGARLDEFGSAVAISGNTVVVGSWGDDDNGIDSGSAYVFVREGGTWIQQAKLLPNDGAVDDEFGIGVAVSEDTVVVGALGDDDNGGRSGSAYVFIREEGAWKQQAKLLPNDGAADDIFGRRVSVSGNTVVVGANWDDDNGSGSGSAYVFIREGDTWKQQAKLLPNDGAAGDQFGIGVAVNGDTVVVGARYDDDNCSSSGSAYVFLLQS